MAATVWKGRLVFGLVSIPIRLHRASRRERIRFHNVYRASRPESAEPEWPEPEPLQRPGIHAIKTGLARVPEPEPPARSKPGPAEPDPETVTRVRNAPVPESGEFPVSRAEILKGYETQPGTYAVVKPSEIAALRPKTSTELEIASFVNPAEIDPLYLDVSYYVWPEKGGERPYALLYKALAESHYAALGALAMHGREYATAIMPGRRGLVLHTLFHTNEIHPEEEFAVDSSLVGGKELEMARKLVAALSGRFEPAGLTDKYEERVRALVESRDRLASEAGFPAPQQPREAPPDLLEALRKSLEAARKPVRREPGRQTGQTRPKPRKDRTAG